MELDIDECGMGREEVDVEPVVAARENLGWEGKAEEMMADIRVRGEVLVRLAPG